MKKSLLDYGLKVRLPILLFVAAATFAATYYASYAERNGIGYQPTQPINFSHKLHAGDMKIDCQYCHIGVEKSRVASIPTVSVPKSAVYPRCCTIPNGLLFFSSLSSPRVS